MFPKQIVRFLNFFDIFGFNTQATKLSKSKKLSYSIIWIHISMAVSFIIYEFAFLYKFYLSYGLMQTVNEFVEYSGSLCAYLLIIFDSLFYRREHQRFWLRFQQISPNSNRPLNVIPRSYTIKLVEFCAVTSVFYLITATFYGLGGVVNITNFISYMVYMIPVKICHIRLFYYMFCLEIILFELKVLHDEINHCKLDRGSHCTKDEMKTLETQQMKWIQKFDCIHELINLLNEFCGLSQAGAVLFCFFALFTDTNSYYVGFSEISGTKLLGEYEISLITQ